MGRRNKGKAVREGASSMDAMDVAVHRNGAEAMAVEGEAVVAWPEPLIAAIRIEGDEGTATPSDHTSSDYYFNSYAHFGIHEGGTKHVYAVECSTMADTAKEIVKANVFSDGETFSDGCGSGDFEIDHLCWRSVHD